MGNCVKAKQSTYKHMDGKPRPMQRVNRILNLENTEALSAQITEGQKSQKQLEDIKRSLYAHFLFSNLSAKNFESIVLKMRHYSLQGDETVYHQGEPGHNFFIVISGKLEILVNNELRGYLIKGNSFGELALMHQTSRTATIRTVKPVCLWGLEGKEFRKTVQSMHEKHYLSNMKFINIIPFFSDLTLDQKEKIVSVMVCQEFANGHKVILEDDDNCLFYIIRKGEVSCSRRGIELRRLGKGDFFGEQALLYSNEPIPTVVTLGTTQILSIGREHLISVLGDQLQLIIYRNIIRIALSEIDALNKYQVDCVLHRMKINRYRKREIIQNAGTPEKIWVLLKGSTSDGRQGLRGHRHEELGEEVYAAEDSDIAEISVFELEESIGGKLSLISHKNESLSAIKEVNFFKSLPLNILERLTNSLRISEYNANEVIANQGEILNKLFIVKSGHVEALHRSKEAFGSLSYFGSVLKEEVCMAKITAKVKSCLYELSREDFENEVEERIRTQLIGRLDLYNTSIQLENCRFVSVLYKGLSNIFLVRNELSNYALKTVHRNEICQHEIYENLVQERQILSQLDHPFIVKLVRTFKDSNRIYYLMEYVNGIDLFDVLQLLNLLNNDISKFYAASLLLVLEHLHEKSIVFRDLRPENVQVDHEGYIKIIDLDSAKLLKGRTYTVIGSPHYVAPEVILGNGYSFAADLWSLGVMIYEFICGVVPFGEDEEDTYLIYEQILKRKLLYPSYVNKSFRAKPIVESLLNQNPALRGSSRDLKNHKWFTGIDWDSLVGKSLEPPYKPSLGHLHATCDKNENLFTAIEKAEANKLFTCNSHLIRNPPEGWDYEF